MQINLAKPTLNQVHDSFIVTPGVNLSRDKLDLLGVKHKNKLIKNRGPFENPMITLGKPSNEKNRK